MEFNKLECTLSEQSERRPRARKMFFSRRVGARATWSVKKGQQCCAFSGMPKQPCCEEEARNAISQAACTAPARHAPLFCGRRPAEDRSCSVCDKHVWLGWLFLSSPPAADQILHPRHYSMKTSLRPQHIVVVFFVTLRRPLAFFRKSARGRN